MRALAAVLLLLPFVVLADIGAQNTGKSLGPVQFLDCVADGGLWCARDAGTGTAVLKMSCAAASGTTPGCLSTGAQTVAGNKTFTGTVAAAVLDAGASVVGSIDQRGNTITGLGASSTFTIQSNTSDGTTTSTVPAMNFSLGSAITSTDQGWCFTDSAGNQRLCGTAAGTWNFAAHTTTAGAPGVNGGGFQSLLGAGGVATGATPGGLGGGWGLFAGAGGASNGTATGGQGGLLSIGGAPGGASSGTATGGQGGPVSLFCGGGGGGRAGGALALSSGSGGNASASWAAGAGGSITMASGSGGFENTGAAANGGLISITSGPGGAGIAGTSGTGGALTLRSGNAGAKGAGAGSFAGVITIDTGTTSVVSDGAAINLGTVNAGAITIGRPDIPHAVVFPGTLASGGQPTQIAQLLLTGDVGGPLSKCSGIGPTSIDFPNILANTCSDQTASVANAVDGDTVFCGFPSGLVTGLAPSCFISAPGVVTFRICNVTVGAINPAAGNFTALRLK